MGKSNTRSVRNRSTTTPSQPNKTKKGVKKGVKNGAKKGAKKGSKKGSKKRSMKGTHKKQDKRMEQIETMWDTIFQRIPEPEKEGMDMKHEIEPLNQKKSNNKPVVILLHATWCGHCKVLAPEWEGMKTSLDKETLNNIIFEEVESAEMDAKMPIISKSYLNGAPFENRGFPTIGSIRNHKFEQYGGQRTTASLVEWVRGLAA
jgi:thiol-disulfide isomerase/thioredoxin